MCCVARFMLVCTFVFVGMLNTYAQEGAIGPAPENLSVLFAGKPGSDRMKAFEVFLKPHFKKVATCDFENFIRSDADGFDVVVFDWPYTRPNSSNVDLQLGPSINIDTFYSRPTVMIGYAASIYSHAQKMAIDSKCVCLENYAHDVNTNHPIFKGPLSVAIEYETIEKPYDYYLFPGTMSLDEKMQAWKIQDKKFPEAAPGVVSSRENFIGTADAEVISNGTNGKGPSSVAIARHGNYFLWGFSAMPSEMSESAKRAFINSLCYMTAFDGKRPGPFKPDYNTDENRLIAIYHLRRGSDAYVAKQVESFERLVKSGQVTSEELKTIGKDPAAYFRTSSERLFEQVMKRIPDEVRKQTGDDIEKIIAYYTEHAEHLHVNAKGQFEVGVQ